MAKIQVETSISVTHEVDTDNFSVENSMEDILESLRGDAQLIIENAIQDDTANITNRVVEVAHSTDGS